MNKQLATIAIVLSALVNESVAAERSARLEAVHRDVRDCIRAVYGGDLDTVMRFTHPLIIKTMGGPEAARATVKQGMQPIWNGGVTLDSLSFPKPPEFLEGGGRQFVIVPTLITVTLRGQRLESLNYQFGVLDPGSQTWKYIEGSRINKQNVQALFPGFPRDYEFPAFYRKKL